MSSSSIESRARWRQYLADERAEAQVYRELAEKREGADREILLSIAASERRHEQHWLTLLGGDDSNLPRANVRIRFLSFLARRFNPAFALALVEREEGRSPYRQDPDATAAMAADERVHGEVVRGLSASGRLRLSGSFRAAVFGANDGLVSNLALVLGVGATGIDSKVVLFTGIAGLLAGALSMAAGEYISVQSQRELLKASAPDSRVRDALADLDAGENDLALIYRARGDSESDAKTKAKAMLERIHGSAQPMVTESIADLAHDAVGTAWGAARSSFLFFATGALIPIIPYLFGLSGALPLVIAVIAVCLTLLATGAVAGVLSGGPPMRSALRQLAIGFGAAAVTYVLGLAFGTVIN